MPDVVQATSQGDALQTSVWVTSVGNGFKTTLYSKITHPRTCREGLQRSNVII